MVYVIFIEQKYSEKQGTCYSSEVSNKEVRFKAGHSKLNSIIETFSFLTFSLVGKNSRN